MVRHNLFIRAVRSEGETALLLSESTSDSNFIQCGVVTLMSLLPDWRDRIKCPKHRIKTGLATVVDTISAFRSFIF